jgi:hypothetical protein
MALYRDSFGMYDIFSVPFDRLCKYIVPFFVYSIKKYVQETSRENRFLAGRFHNHHHSVSLIIKYSTEHRSPEGFLTKGYFCILAVFFSIAAQASAQSDSAYEQKTITAVRTAESITMDGVLSEPAWKEAIPASRFVQADPSEGAPATEDTEVRIIYDNDNLYIGVICRETDPSTIIHNELKYDGEVGDDDHFEFVIDTFSDRRNAFYFAINANGARLDGKLSSASGNVGTVNRDWNGIWDVATRIGDAGWTAEFVIPFRTLRFPDTPAQTWGINFKREMMGKREESLWTGWRRNDNIFQLSTAGKLSGLENIQRGSLLELKPFVLAGASTEWKRRPGGKPVQGRHRIKNRTGSKVSTGFRPYSRSHHVHRFCPGRGRP